MKGPQYKRARDERGVSLVEVIVGMVMLAAAVLGLVGASGLALQTTIRGRRDMQLWAALQWKADSLVSVGWGSVTNGTDTVQGYPMNWTGTGTDLEQIDILVDYPSLMTGAAIQDTLVIYLTQ